MQCFLLLWWWLLHIYHYNSVSAVEKGLSCSSRNSFPDLKTMNPPGYPLRKGKPATVLLGSEEKQPFPFLRFILMLDRRETVDEADRISVPEWELARLGTSRHFCCGCECCHPKIELPPDFVAPLWKNVTCHAPTSFLLCYATHFHSTR